MGGLMTLESRYGRRVMVGLLVDQKGSTIILCTYLGQLALALGLCGSIRRTDSWTNLDVAISA